MGISTTMDRPPIDITVCREFLCPEPRIGIPEPAGVRENLPDRIRVLQRNTGSQTPG